MSQKFQITVGNDAANAINQWAGLIKEPPSTIAAWIVETAVRQGFVTGESFEEFRQVTNEALPTDTTDEG